MFYCPTCCSHYYVDKKNSVRYETRSEHRALIFCPIFSYHDVEEIELQQRSERRCPKETNIGADRATRTAFSQQEHSDGRSKSFGTTQVYR